MKTELQNTFLSLIRLGIGNGTVAGFRFQVSGSINWNALEDLAARHGLSAVIVDGIEKLPEGQRPPQMVLLQWIGETLQSYEYRYEAYKKAIAELAAFYNHHGFKMMVLKGYACSLDWPKPDHRPCGDIDIWQFGQYKNADRALTKETGIIIDNSHHHHTVFCWKDFMVENHYDFINIHQHKTNIALENIFKQKAIDEPRIVSVIGEQIYLPSSNFHALFLLRHLMSHFASDGISLRQILDWAFFMRAHHHEVDWEWFLTEIDGFGMSRMFNILNAICVEDLGFEVSIFPTVQFEPILKERVLKEILSLDISEKEPRGLLRRVVFKYHRWKSNEWKHELCYKESMRSAFWSGVWSHILKPSSI